MTREVLAVPPTSELDELALRLVAGGRRLLPVVDGDRLVGVVARSDLLRALPGWSNDSRRESSARGDLRPCPARSGAGHGWVMAAPPRVLVAHATAAGSTAGIAERIAAVLSAAGCEVSCRAAAHDLELSGYDAVVLGSAVHDMAWLPPAVGLLPRVAALDVPVWCFSVGGVTPHGRLSRAVVAREADRLERQFPTAFVPREHRVFGGVVQMAGIPLWGKLFYLATGGRAGDHRDWPAIDAWASTIADVVRPVRGGDTVTTRSARGEP
jgi:menaquinone-dependent protoporphyrinogen oxidase